MSRLIDADELIKAIKNHKTNVESGSGFANEIYALAHEHIIDVITIQPTAFDTEKVVEQLEVLKEKGYAELMMCEVNELIDKSINIVKKGGVE